MIHGACCLSDEIEREANLTENHDEQGVGRKILDAVLDEPAGQVLGEVAEAVIEGVALGLTAMLDLVCSALDGV